MTEKELKELGEHINTIDGMEESLTLDSAVEDGRKTIDSLTDREVILYNLLHDHTSGDPAYVLAGDGTYEEKKEFIRLLRKALTTGKLLIASRGMDEGIFNSQEEMEEYMSQLTWCFELI